MVFLATSLYNLLHVLLFSSIIVFFSQDLPGSYRVTSLFPDTSGMVSDQMFGRIFDKGVGVVATPHGVLPRDSH